MPKQMINLGGFANCVIIRQLEWFGMVCTKNRVKLTICRICVKMTQIRNFGRILGG